MWSVVVIGGTLHQYSFNGHILAELTEYTLRWGYVSLRTLSCCRIDN